MCEILITPSMNIFFDNLPHSAIVFHLLLATYWMEQMTSSVSFSLGTPCVIYVTILYNEASARLIQCLHRITRGLNGAINPGRPIGGSASHLLLERSWPRTWILSPTVYLMWSHTSISRETHKADSLWELCINYAGPETPGHEIDGQLGSTWINELSSWSGV